MSEINAAVVVLPIADQLCKDLLTTAMEGGSNYWLACKDVRRDEEMNVVHVTRCRDAEDSSNKFDDVTLNTMRLGVQRLLAPGADVASNIRSELLALMLDPDDTSWDVWTADAVLQFGLLGSLVYG